MDEERNSIREVLSAKGQNIIDQNNEDIKTGVFIGSLFFAANPTISKSFEGIFAGAIVKLTGSQIVEIINDAYSKAKKLNKLPENAKATIGALIVGLNRAHRRAFQYWLDLSDDNPDKKYFERIITAYEAHIQNLGDLLGR